MSDVRPIILAGATALTAVRETATAALDEWAANWVMSPGEDAPPSLPVNVSMLDVETVAAHGYEALTTTQGTVWVERGELERRAFGQAVVGTDFMPRATCSDEWIAALVEQAWNARNRALCGSLFAAMPQSTSGPTGPLPAHLFAFGSGAICVVCERVGLRAIADAAVWRNIAPSGRHALLPPLQKLDRAIGHSGLRLDVMLGGVELEVTKLLDLRRGDVLRLSQRLDQPLVALCNDMPVGRALLGQLQDCKGVQFVTGLPHHI